MATNKANKASKPAAIAAPIATAPIAVTKPAKAAPLPLNTPAGLAQMAVQRYANPQGKCGAVWAWARAQHAAGTLPTAAAYAAANPTANVCNTKIELGYWARATGVALPRAPRTVTVQSVAVAA